MTYYLRDRADALRKYDHGEDSDWKLSQDIADWCEYSFGYIPQFFDPDHTFKPHRATSDMVLEFQSEDDYAMFKLKFG